MNITPGSLYLVAQTHKNRAVYDQKEPYTDEEVKKLLNEAEKHNGATHGYAKHPKTFRLLLELMLETRMRAFQRFQVSSR